MSFELSIEIQGLTFRYAKSSPWLFERLSWQVGPSEKVWVSGPNGSGKTTLFQIMMGWILPEQGSVRLAGLPAGDRQTRRYIGYSPSSDSHFVETASARANLEFHAKVFDVRGPDYQSRLDELDEIFECRKFLNHQVQELSSGYQKRLSLIRALLHRPQVLLLDEPLDHLDVQMKKRLLDFLSNCPETVLVSSHDHAARPSVFESHFQIGGIA